MPGNSLWLIPPPSHPLTATLQHLITNSLPPLFPSPVPNFQPHITITSDIPLSSPADAQQLLASLALPTPLPIKLKSIEAGDTFFTKVTIHLEKTPELLEVAKEARVRCAERGEEEAQEWVKETYTPHLSLVYAEMSREMVEREVLGEVKRIAGEARVLKEETAWEGGKLVLVECWRPIEEWKVLAEREL